MGDTTTAEPEPEEPTPQEKAYCCSNYPQTEAGYIAKFDFVLLLLGLIAAIISITAVATDEDPPPPKAGEPIPLVYNETITGDPSYFFYWPMHSQLIVLSMLLVGCVVRLIFTVVLLIGVYKKKHGLLLTWFISTVVYVLMVVILEIIVIAYAHGKVLFSAITVTYFLYKWYCLWIVKLLMSEVRGVREGYTTNQLEDSGEIEQANNLMPNSDSFTVDKF